MAPKTLILLILTNIIIARTQDITSDETRPVNKDSEEIQEDTTAAVDEEEYKTTTEFIVTDEDGDGDTKNADPESIETATEESNVDVTASSLNNVLDDSERNLHSNLTNNIDTSTKTETMPMQATTRSMEEESPPKTQESEEEVETPGQRNPKADTDSKPPLDKRNFDSHPAESPPQTTRSVVRGWLQDCWIRPPAGIMVPLRATALARALAVWGDLNVPALNLTHVLVMGYDSNGVNWRSRHNLQPASNSHEKTVAEALSKLLLKYQGVNTDATNDGTMRALATAAKLVPYDSALFVVTDKGPGDPQRLPLALRALVEKRLKVYTIWTDPSHPSTESEEALQELRNISKHTEGELIAYPLQVMDMDGASNLAAETELEQWNPLDIKQGRRGRLNSNLEMEKFDLLLVRRGGGQAISLGFPVENGVTALRIFIEGAVEHAVLYPPNDGPQIDLYNITSVATFSPHSRTEGLSPRDVYLIFDGAQYDPDALSVLPARTAAEIEAAFVGMWHLSVRCDTCDYRLCVSARASIHFDVETNTPDTLKFRITGPVASVRESQLVDEYTTELAKLPFSYQPLAGDGKNEEKDPTVKLEPEVPLPALKVNKVYAKIVGRDLKGEPFIRLSGPINQPEIRMGRSASILTDYSNDMDRMDEVDPRAYSAQLVYNDSAQPYNRAVSQIVSQQGTLLTSIQIGLSSRLYGAPGENLQLHFEVTNYREQTVRFNFGASGELRFLTGISPTAQNVGSGQTVNVIVSLTIPSNAQPGLRDTITFTAYGNGNEQVSLSAYVYVANSAAPTDTWPPELRHTFQGTCLGRTGDDCAQHTWATTVVARDALSGLLRISSSPIGVMYSSDFVSGTRQEVMAIYRATCCAPRVVINAVDAYGNANSYTIDISGYLTDAAIAAIVLGVLLGIALIILLIASIVWCVRKRKESRELPSYNTSRN
ncbi:uncharacterized protein LOC110378641 isoform X1 [Helicoverpa armigera]|uniref:uncharacterized protein LOC110378641 isoform X1 n=2 Tax=Helicoverpa armigera TaxID=29058 RepID=UPI00308369C0